jgi:ABC-2 type transport system permease protein
MTGTLTAQLRYHMLLLARTPRAVFAGVLLPVVLLVLRGGSGSDHAQVAVVAGLIGLAVISTAYLTHAAGLVAARESGVLRRWRATPLPPAYFVFARMTATVVMAVASAAGMTVAAIAYDGVRPDAAALGQLAAVVVVGALTWTALGTAATAIVPTAESAQPLLALTCYPVLLLSGGFGTAGGVSGGWLSDVLSRLPAVPLIDAAQRALTGSAGFPSGDYLTLAAWASVGVLAALLRFRWQPVARAT